MSGALPSDRAVAADAAEPEVSALRASIPSADGFFPYTLRAYETPHYTSSPHDFRATFLATRPADESWFAYDVVVKSETDVEFIVYGMRDNFSGGIGGEKFRFATTVAPDVTRPSIEGRILDWARNRRERENEAHEAAIIASYAADLAQAIEARRAETAQTGSVHESAVAESDAP